MRLLVALGARNTTRHEQARIDGLIATYESCNVRAPLDGVPPIGASCVISNHRESKTMRSFWQSLLLLRPSSSMPQFHPKPRRPRASTTPREFLAGMPPSANSPLRRLTREPAWQQHARHFDAAWASLDNSQLGKVRAWTART